MSDKPQIKLSVGKPSGNFKINLGFAFMKFGLNIAKSSLPHNIAVMLETAINDSEFIIKENIKYLEADYSKVETVTKDIASSWFWDGKYRYTTLTDWKKIIRTDLIDRLKYYAEYFDCENFAVLFSAVIDVIYGLNSAGVALGEVLDKNTKQGIGYHAYNALIVDNNGNLEIWLYEPQADILKKASKITDMDWALYRTDFIIWR